MELNCLKYYQVEAERIEKLLENAESKEPRRKRFQHLTFITRKFACNCFVYILNYMIEFSL